MKRVGGDTLTVRSDGLGVPLLATMSPEEQDELAEALRVLTKGSGLLSRLMEMTTGLTARIGTRGLKMMPGLQAAVSEVAEAALGRAFDIAILGLPSGLPRSKGRVGAAIVGVSGAIGGFAGLAGFVPDAFVTTLSIMRSVAQIAQAEGEDLTVPDSRLACLKVFATSLEGGFGAEGSPDVSYFITRSALQGRSVMMLLSEVAGRYGITLSQKLTLQAVPLLGAASGVGLNLAYMAHYRAVARAVFVVRRLQRKYGVDIAHDFTSL